MRLNKKAALSLSIEAIVIIVVAFVVLGLALTLTRTVFKLGTSKVGEAISVVDLDVKPSADNTITLERVTIGRNDNTELKIGYYNKGTTIQSNATLFISECKNAAGNPSTPLPSVSTIAQNVPASDSVGYKAIFTENGLAPGNYICTLQVKEFGATREPYDSKQFFLTVTP